ncbi:MAG TPA: secretin N-terminal domain-containing protein [Methylophilaceae bacterium]|nr:secretin N-terminal domain-containing protein [Methylophilaceae bacterium]
MRRLYIFILLMAGLFAMDTAQAQTEFKIITLQHRFAHELVPLVQPMVGPGGNASAIDNQLLIRATPERMAEIEQLVAKLDVSRRNVRITVSNDSSQQMQRDRLGVTGRGRVGDVEVQVPRGAREGVNVEIDRRESSITNRGSQFLTVLDGERAFIRVGQSVPFTQQWVMLTQRYLNIQQTTEFRDITTGFAVRPRYIGDQVELEIAPRIARLNSAGFVDFEELATVVRLSPGQWFDLGGTMQSKDEVSRAILSNQQNAGTQNSGLMIKVD